MKNGEDKLTTLLEIEGMELDEIAGESLFGTRIGVPAICCNEGCDYTEDKEPDSTRGWCDVCKTNSMKSALILAGII